MNLHDLGANGIISAVVLALTVIGFIKGLIRTVLALVCLGIAGYAALWGHAHAADITGHTGPWLPKIIAGATGLAVFFICRRLLKFLVDPFNSSKTGERIGFGLPAAALSLCSGLLVLWLAFAGIRYAGSLAEIRHIQHITSEKTEPLAGTPPPAPSILLEAKHMLDASSAGKWHRRTDPFHTPGKLTLCKILILYHHSRSRAAMLRDAKFNPLLNHPDFLVLAYREGIAGLATSGDPKELFSSPAVREAASSQPLAALIRQISAEEISNIARH